MCGRTRLRTPTLVAVALLVAVGCRLAAGATASAAKSAAVVTSAATGGQAAAHVASSGPSVQTMVIGSGGRAISETRAVTAAATSVKVGARTCAVAAGTPLAALAALARGGGPKFALRDYGHCGASAANSGELFVDSLAGESNSGRSGWVYKVGGVAGSTGAGDPSGPSGNGRLLSAGEQLLWFWCVASGAGCQRTLGLNASATSVGRGGSLTVTVSSYNNEGQRAPVSGAIVTLSSDFASTAANGQATVIAPSTPGRYQLIATRRGLVQSFAETIVVR